MATRLNRANLTIVDEVSNYAYDQASKNCFENCPSRVNSSPVLRYEITYGLLSSASSSMSMHPGADSCKIS